MDFINSLTQHLPDVVFVLTAIVTTCAGLSTVLDSKNSDPIIQKIIKVIDLFAFNWGKARNADVVKQPRVD